MEIRGELSRDRKLLAHKIICQVAKITNNLTEDLVKGSTSGKGYGREIRRAKAVTLQSLKYYGFTHTQAALIVGLKGSNASNLSKWYHENFTYSERKNIREEVQRRVIR